MEWSLISVWLHHDPLQSNGHWFLCHVKALCKAMVIDFLVASRPSAKQWSLISSHHDPLQGNSHRYLCHIETLFIEMVIDFSSSRPSPWDWPNLFWVVTLFSVIATKSFWGLNLDPLLRIGHRTRLILFLFTFFFLFEIRTKFVSLSLLIFYYETMKSQFSDYLVKSK